MKRIVTVQDISCLGKCSLTVALPIISAMGAECCIIPTAVLSTHTAFSGYTFYDLTDQIQKISDHWQKEKLSFDAVYTGYLGSFEQIDLMKRLFSDNKNALKFVDPAMGDNGKLYPGFDRAFAEKMASLCSVADVIVPNLTEAAFMLGEEYIEKDYSEGYIKNMLEKLCLLGAKKAVITGVSFEKNIIGAMLLDSATGAYHSYFTQKIGRMYHGTGDIFASACLGALVSGRTLSDSVKIAADYTAECIRLTVDDKDGRWYGVNFEEAIPYLTELMKQAPYPAKNTDNKNRAEYTTL